VSLVDQSRVEWATGRAAIAGTNNWVPEGSALVPSELAATLTGRDPRFVAAERRDVRVAEGSPLANAGNPSPQPVAGRAVPAALLAPLFDPPLRTLERVGSARRRADLARPSIGAFHLPAPTRAPNGESPPKGGDTGAEDPSSSTPSPGDPLGPSGSDAPPQGGATGPFLPALGAPYFDTLEQGGCSLARTKGGPRSAGAEAMLFAVGLVALGAKARRKKP
jgi:MYXO-CTERM domain-containing protein